MAVVTFNDLDVLEAEIAIPRMGAWTANLIIPDNGDDALTTGTAATIVLGTQTTQTLTGTVQYGGTHHDDQIVRVVGGAGGLGLDATPKFYSSPTVRVVLVDLLRVAGESLSGSADSSLLANRLNAWTTIKEPTSRQISALVTALNNEDAVWRIGTDGKLWLGVDSWADADLDYQEMNIDPKLWKMTLSSEEPSLLPGTKVDGNKVGYVSHRISDLGVLTTAWFEQ